MDIIHAIRDMRTGGGVESVVVLNRQWGHSGQGGCGVLLGASPMGECYDVYSEFFVLDGLTGEVMFEQFPIGAHLVTPRRGYKHHGVYMGGGRVIHYAGLADELEAGPVKETDLDTFCGGQGLAVKTYKDAFPPDQIIERARRRLGESRYSVFNNNCEHFCLWCILGKHESVQVDSATWVSAPSVAALIGLGARAAVAVSGTVVGVSGPGVMSGLASTGAVVGGGAVAGLGLLGGVPGAAMASFVNKTVLADNPVLEDEERTSRSFGRKASYVGAATGTAGSIFAVGVAGVTSGFSAPGITSGLAAIGGIVGGGMASGVIIATATPVAVAATAGYGVYKIVRKLKSKRLSKNT